MSRRNRTLAVGIGVGLAFGAAFGFMANVGLGIGERPEIQVVCLALLGSITSMREDILLVTDSPIKVKLVKEDRCAS